VVMLLLLLAAIAMFPVDHEHHYAVAEHDHHVSGAACVTQHHYIGAPIPEHGHRHEADVVSNLTPRSRLTAPDVVVALAVACGSATDSPVPRSRAAPPVPPDVDLHLLGVLRV
jgi:hypothetical protein